MADTGSMQALRSLYGSVVCGGGSVSVVLFLNLGVWVCREIKQEWMKLCVSAIETASAPITSD